MRLKKNCFFLYLILCLFSCGEEPNPSVQSKDISKSTQPDNRNMVLIPAGTLQMGGDNKQASPNEFPKHPVEINSFWMDETEVTNEQFMAFTKATGYVTVAERPVIWAALQKGLPPNTPKPPDSLLQPGALVFQSTSTPVQLTNPGLWWHWTIGANWQHPEGPDSDLKNIMQHPVTQMAWEDAAAYAKWAGKRLATEAEWEWASRGGKVNTIYPWGNESVNEGVPKANFWQGIFPHQNAKKDGYLTTAPVKTFAPNDYGLYDMAGNVWEWCADWYDDQFYKKPESLSPNTLGPQDGFTLVNPYEPHKVLRGGSFLCNDDYCSGYRNARRMSSSIDTGLNHTGFRCVRDVE